MKITQLYNTAVENMRARYSTISDLATIFEVYFPGVFVNELTASYNGNEDDGLSENVIRVRYFNSKDKTENRLVLHRFMETADKSCLLDESEWLFNPCVLPKDLDGETRFKFLTELKNQIKKILYDYIMQSDDVTENLDAADASTWWGEIIIDFRKNTLTAHQSNTIEITTDNMFVRQLVQRSPGLLKKKRVNVRLSTAEA